MVTRRTRSRAVRAVIVVAALVLATVTALDAGTALITRVPLEQPEAILSLGSHEWERLPAAAEYARATPAALVFLSQPKAPSVHNCHDCAQRVEQLVARGVAPQRIVMLSQRVSNTREEAAAARTESERRGIRRLLVVTSPYHTRRAWRIFQRTFAGSNVAVGIVPSFPLSPADPERWWAAAYDRAYVRYEWAAMVYDWLRFDR
jgi:uncharacterized SAM-binding protein YcdF (DUF218 family)